MKKSPTERILELARREGVLRVQDLRRRGIHPEYLRRLCHTGQLTRTGRGLYILSDADYSEYISYAQVAKWVPHGVVCLLSALRFHNMGTQMPRKVWIAVEGRSARPGIEYPPIRVCRFSGTSFSEGVEEHNVEGVSVRVYDPAKTVVDCFKYRNKIGLDVFLEALKDGRASGKFRNDELWTYAKACRVTTVIRPYLEAAS